MEHLKIIKFTFMSKHLAISMPSCKEWRGTFLTSSLAFVILKVIVMMLSMSASLSVCRARRAPRKLAAADALPATTNVQSGTSSKELQCLYARPVRAEDDALKGARRGPQYSPPRPSSDGRPAGPFFEFVRSVSLPVGDRLATDQIECCYPYWARSTTESDQRRTEADRNVVVGEII